MTFNNYLRLHAILSFKETWATLGESCQWLDLRAIMAKDRAAACTYAIFL